MKNKLLKTILVIALIFIIYSLFSPVQAIANIKKYTYATKETNKDSERMINGGTICYSTPSSVYDFIDEDNLFNTVYVSENNVYWTKFDKSYNIISTVSWPLFYNVNNEESKLAQMYKSLVYNFGNALYYNGELYVMYSRLATSDTLAKQYEENVMAMAKYNKKGELLKVIEYKGVDLNASSYYDNNGTVFPFYSSNCSLAINEDRIFCFFGRNMYNSHQASLLMVIDPDSLEFISNMRDKQMKDPAMYYYIYNHSISHSLGQRIIPTSDGQFLMMEVGDASSRGLMLTKIYKEYNDKVQRDILNRKSRRIFHFREGGSDKWGYNNTYSALGNIIEVNDGYIYIGSSERTLSLAYGDDINESWDVFVQKISKDFYNENKSDEEIQLLKTEIRTTSGEKSEYNGEGRLYLKGTEKDYGIKWLTNLQNKYMALMVRAIKMENDNIAIMWEQVPMEYRYNTYQDKWRYCLIDDEDRENAWGASGDIYYMVIDKNANIITEPTMIPNVRMNEEEHYMYKDGKISWTSVYGKKIIVNVLDVKNPLTVEKGDVNKDGKINLSDAIQVLRKAILGGTLTDDEKATMDINGDGKVNLLDALQILRKAILG